jgi:PPM family protein phosphatase
MKFSVFQISRRGGRANNEDRMGYVHNHASGLFVLADGMGGHPEGEVAAQMALQCLSAQYQAQARPAVENPGRFLSEALQAAHQQLVRYATDKAMLDVPRTTLVAALLQNGQAQWIHCGDSRLYVVRRGKLLLRTRDHSFFEHQEAAGQSRGEPVNRNILFSCLGSPSEPVFDLSEPLTLVHGDRVFLCSDGLWGNLSEKTITRRLAEEHRPLADVVNELVDQALRDGGKRCDNVTALAFEWDGDDAAHTEQVSSGGFASTIQGVGPTDPWLDTFDDAAIERSIAEINDAIRRTAAKKI